MENLLKLISSASIEVETKYEELLRCNRIPKMIYNSLISDGYLLTEKRTYIKIDPLLEFEDYTKAFLRLVEDDFYFEIS